MTTTLMEPVKTFQLEIEAEPHQTKDILRVLHTILFHRLLGPTKPKDVHLDFPRITYVKCDNATLDREVDSHIHEALATVHGNNTVITLSFFERNERRGWLSFGVVAEREWERWVLKLTIREVRSEEEHKKFRQMLERNLQGCLMYISTMSSEYREHLPSPPPPPSSEPIRSSHYRISIPNGNGGESWGGIIKKIISDTATSNILN